MDLPEAPFLKLKTKMVSGKPETKWESLDLSARRKFETFAFLTCLDFRVNEKTDLHNWEGASQVCSDFGWDEHDADQWTD